MQTIQIVANMQQRHAAGMDVTVVSLGEVLRPHGLPSGQWAFAVGARGGSMWQLISRPFPSREEAESFVSDGFEPLATDVALRCHRSLIAAGIARVVEEELSVPVRVRVSGKPCQLEQLKTAYSCATSLFGSYKVSNPPGEVSPPSFEVGPVEESIARSYRKWLEDERL
jgi:hypothetical protein